MLFDCSRFVKYIAKPTIVIIKEEMKGIKKPDQVDLESSEEIKQPTNLMEFLFSFYAAVFFLMPWLVFFALHHVWFFLSCFELSFALFVLFAAGRKCLLFFKIGRFGSLMLAWCNAFVFVWAPTATIIHKIDLHVDDQPAVRNVHGNTAFDYDFCDGGLVNKPIIYMMTSFVLIALNVVCYKACRGFIENIDRLDEVFGEDSIVEAKDEAEKPTEQI